MPGKFEIKRASNGQFYFNMKSGNGEVILTGETYVSKQGAQIGIESAKINASVDSRYDRLTSTAGQPYFILRAANGEPLGRSEMYSSTAARENGIASVKTNAPAALVVDLT
jgi:uncharacterized protein